MLIRRGDVHGLDGDDAEFAAGGEWGPPDICAARQQYIEWTLACHRQLDADFRLVRVRAGARPPGPQGPQGGGRTAPVRRSQPERSALPQ